MRNLSKPFLSNKSVVDVQNLHKSVSKILVFFKYHLHTSIITHVEACDQAYIASPQFQQLMSNAGVFCKFIGCTLRGPRAAPPYCRLKRFVSKCLRSRKLRQKIYAERILELKKKFHPAVGFFIFYFVFQKLVFLNAGNRTTSPNMTAYIPVGTYSHFEIPKIRDCLSISFELSKSILLFLKRAPVITVENFHSHH